MIQHAIHRMRMRLGWAIILSHLIAFLIGLALALALFCAAKWCRESKYKEYQDGMTLTTGEYTVIAIGDTDATR